MVAEWRALAADRQLRSLCKEGQQVPTQGERVRGGEGEGEGERREVVAKVAGESREKGKGASEQERRISGRGGHYGKG